MRFKNKVSWKWKQSDTILTTEQKQLAADNYGLVIFFVGKFANTQTHMGIDILKDRDSYIDVATAGYLNAIRHYDKEKGKLSTVVHVAVLRRIQSLYKKRQINISRFFSYDDRESYSDGDGEREAYFNVHKGDIADDNTPEIIAMQNEENSILFDAISKLPTQEKELIRLYYIENCSSQVIADMFHKSRQTILNKINVALDKLHLDIAGAERENKRVSTRRVVFPCRSGQQTIKRHKKLRDTYQKYIDAGPPYPSCVTIAKMVDCPRSTVLKDLHTLGLPTNPPRKKKKAI